MPPTAITGSATLTKEDAIELYRRLGLPPIGGGDGTDEKPTGDPPNPDPKPGDQKPNGGEPLGENGKKALESERKLREAADKRAADAEKKLADIETAKAKANEEEAVRKGEFEKLADERKAALDAAKADGEAMTKRLERANARIAAAVDERVKELEALKDDELMAAFPKDADPLDQMEWLDDPRTKRAIAAATEDKKVVDAQGKPKVPKTPKPNGDGKPEIKSLVNARTF